MCFEMRTICVLTLFNRNKHVDDLFGHQIYQVGSCRCTYAGVWMLEKDGQRDAAGSEVIQAFDDCIHKMPNLGLTVRIQQFVVKCIRKPGGKFKSPH